VKRGKRETDLRVRGLGLKARFVLTLTLALTPILAVFGFLLYVGASRIASDQKDAALSQATRFTHDERPYEDQGMVRKDQNEVEIHRFTYGPKNDKTGRFYRYAKKDPLPHETPFAVYVPDQRKVGDEMLGMIVGFFVVILVAGAGAGLWVASQVSRPIHKLIDDVRQIAKGNLAHRTKVVGAGEIELLSRAIDRMTKDLDEAQEAQLKLSIREREINLASGVREALLPLTTPLLEGYDVGAAFISSEAFGGDFHDFIERPDGSVGLLVCEVSGRGVPAALVGATARSYLRTELERSDDVGEIFRRVNRWLAGDVRRGMFVTALYCLIDHTEGRATVACAGHKIPLLRYAAADRSLRVVHPEGIALGFDKGPVFDRKLEIVDTPIEKGDRLVLTNSAAITVKSYEGAELGEKNFYGRVKKHATVDTGAFLKALRGDLNRFAGEGGVQEDVSLVTVSREG